MISFTIIFMITKYAIQRREKKTVIDGIHKSLIKSSIAMIELKKW